MSKDSIILETILPDPNQLDAEAPKITDENNVNMVALRRSKVRELVRMGYEPHQIVLVLQKGIKIANDKKIAVPVTEYLIKKDIEYIEQEDTSVDVNIPGKRAEILDKLKFLYNRAIREYLESKGAMKNSFLNTALSILNKRMELEGLKALDASDLDTSDESKVTSMADEVNKLTDKERDDLVKSIREVLKNGKQEGLGESGISNITQGIPAQTSNDEGVLG